MPDEGPDDTHHHVRDDAHLGIGLHDDTGEPTEDAADNDDHDPAHRSCPSGPDVVGTARPQAIPAGAAASRHPPSYTPRGVIFDRPWMCGAGRGLVRGPSGRDLGHHADRAISTAPQRSSY